MTLPYLERLPEQFRRTANRHSFRVAFKPGRKIKRLNANFKSRLVKSKNAFYTGCLVRARILYMLEPWRLFQTRKKEHMDKVRVTNEDLHKGNTIARKTDKQRGWRPSMAHHGVPKWCWWGNAEIVARKRGLKQRKVLEGIESLRQRRP